MSQFPGPGSSGGWLAGLTIVLGLAALAWKIHPVLFWLLLAACVGALFYKGKR